VIPCIDKHPPDDYHDASEGTTRVALSARKKRPARVFLVALLLIILYFILFPYPLGREIVAKPVWAVPIDGSAASVPVTANTAAAPFQLGDTFGYVGSGGGILHAEKTLFRVSLSAAGYVNYTRLGTDWIMYDPSGARLFSFSGRGYPLLSPDGLRLFNIKSDLTGIIELNRAGETVWERDFPTLMTSISLQGDSLLVGLLDGALLMLNRQGSPVFERSPGGSRIPVILGCVVSPDAALLASVSGIDPQTLTVLGGQGSAYTTVGKITLASDFRREPRMSFSPDSRFLAVEGKRSVGLFDPATARISWINLSGDLAGIGFPGRGRFAAVAARNGPRAELRILAPFSAPIARETFPAQELFLGGIDGQLLLGLNGKLLRIDVEAM
jgi:hypothetical protein